MLSRFVSNFRLKGGNKIKNPSLPVAMLQWYPASLADFGTPKRPGRTRGSVQTDIDPIVKQVSSTYTKRWQEIPFLP